MENHDWTAVAEILRAADYPSNRQDLINHARQRGADSRTMSLIETLPSAIYRNLVDVRDRLRPGLTLPEAS